ncbi:MAG: UvrD-helicase domain-containing protein [Betaproteobacteria bacterium]|jgi:ATP-dependent DNA helicase Rep|nr:UvrD-helicase domain-containing protein [Betaproteobacteria bacterium]
MSFPLNPAQREAVRYVDGPLLVLAGAGSGKTRVIAAKIGHLLAQGHDPGAITAITFTNKAAREMKERVAGLLKAQGAREAADRIAISTFHALGLRIIRADARALGLKPAFSILAPTDIESLVAELLGSTDAARARAAQWTISRWKNALVSPGAAAQLAQNDDEAAAAQAYLRYDDTLRAYQAVDFDDLIALPIALLEAQPEVAARWRQRCAQLLVDEYQDTNPAQYRLLKILAGEAAAFTAVGDDDQAIYGWRGASLDNLAQLPRDYPALKVIKLEQNYRSTVRILRSANALIANNPKLFEKKLWSEHGAGDPIRVTPAADDEAEAEGVVRRILAHKFEHRGRYADYAVLYRGNHQARLFEQQLRAQNVPYTISGGQSYFERTEIKDLVAYLRLIANDDDDPAFIRAVTTPKRGVGAATLQKLGAIAGARHESLFAAVFAPEAAATLPARQREILDAFCTLINGLRFRAEREPAGRLLDELVAAIGYDDHLAASCEKREAEARSKSVADFVRWLSTKGEADQRNLLELTQTIALITLLEGQEGAAPDAVHLSTLHAAKGLEFPHVFLVGLEEGILPHRESIANGSVDEERRLMYVGVTRAERSLHLSYCRKRRRAGETVACLPSRFIGELAQDDLRWAGAALPADEAAQEKAVGSERLKNLKAMLAR